MLIIGTVRTDLYGGQVTPSRITLTKEGRVEGNIVAGEAVIEGTVIGNITTSGQTELLAGAVVQGDIRAKKLIKHDEAKHIGRQTIEETAQ